MDLKRTLVLVKPDGVQRGLVGAILGRLEATGMKIVGLKLMQVSEDLAQRHYAEHEGKPFYEGLVSYITSAPVVALCLEGPDAIAITRKLMGATSPNDAAPGTIRGDFGVEISRNLVHGSANSDDAAREVGLFFSDAEMIDYARANDVWIISDED
ncbi:MAG: nucleoside-diphosphate kinase [Chloroflexi bacterium]|nr:nucleoside-diphosphate kinase [Chloroflexota bacterium]